MRRLELCGELICPRAHKTKHNRRIPMLRGRYELPAPNVETQQIAREQSE